MQRGLAPPQQSHWLNLAPILSVFTSLHLTPPPNPALDSLYPSIQAHCPPITCCSSSLRHHDIFGLNNPVSRPNSPVLHPVNIHDKNRNHITGRPSWSCRCELSREGKSVFGCYNAVLPDVSALHLQSFVLWWTHWDYGWWCLRLPQEEGPSPHNPCDGEQAALPRRLMQTSRKLRASRGRILGKSDKPTPCVPFFYWSNLKPLYAA